MRHRRVYCQGFDGRDVGESDCSATEKPSGSDICDMGSCSANTWFFTEWTGQVCTVISLSKKTYFRQTQEFVASSSFSTFVSLIILPVFGRMRNWDPDTQSSLFQQQRNGLRREQEARHIQDLCLGKRLQRQVVCRTLVSGIFIFYYFFLLSVDVFWDGSQNKQKMPFLCYILLKELTLICRYFSIIFSSVRQRAMKELRLERSYV
jgi:hypothetical protein